MHNSHRIPDVQKIAVLRANGIGDFIFALPALEALRSAYPEAEIVYLGKEWHREYLRGRPGPVDRVIVTPPSRGVNDIPGVEEDPAALRAFFHNVRRENFDLAIQLHGGGRNSNPFVLRLGARVTAGTRTPDAAAPDRWIPYVYFQREVLRMLEVVSLVGAPPTTIEPQLTVLPSDVAESCHAVPGTDAPLVALHPGAGDPERWWPAEYFAEVGDALAGAGAQVVVTGSHWESELADRVCQGMKRPALNLAGQLSLPGLTGLLNRSNLLVSNDSGPLHLAGAVGARTVGIYWGFNYVNAGPMTTARHRPQISWRTVCRVCGNDRAYQPCPHHSSFVSDVTPDQVIAAALSLLNE